MTPHCRSFAGITPYFCVKYVLAMLDDFDFCCGDGALTDWAWFGKFVVAILVNSDD